METYWLHPVDCHVKCFPFVQHEKNQRDILMNKFFSLRDKSFSVITSRKVLGDRSDRKDDKVTGWALLCWPQIMLCQYTSTIRWPQA